MIFSPHYGLALYTAGQNLGLGLSNFTSPARCQDWPLGRDLSVYLHQYLAAFLPPQTWADLDFITVARGPGSFTGTRMGMVTARTLAQQLQIPLFAFSTLAAAAWAIAPPGSINSLIAVEMPAQSQQIYGAIFRISATHAFPILELPEQIFSLEQWQQTLAELEQPYQKVHVDGSSPDTITLCRSLLEFAHHQWQLGDRPHWSLALPFYGQQAWRLSNG